MTPFNSAEYKKQVLLPLTQDRARMDALKSAVADLKADPGSESYLSIDLPFLFAIPAEARTSEDLTQHGRKLAQAYNKSQNLPAATQLKHLRSLLSASGRFEDPTFWSRLSDRRREVVDARVRDAILSMKEEAPLGVVPESAAALMLSSLGIDESDVPELAEELKSAGVTVFPDLERPLEDSLLPVRNTWDRVRKHAEYRSIFHLLALKDGGAVRAARCVDELSIDGQQITPTSVTESHRRTQTGRDTNAIQDAQKFLAELSRIDDPEQLRQIAFATVWADAAELSARGMPTRLVVESLAGAGIDDFDARRIAASIRARGAATGTSLDTDSVRRLLASGRLDEAARTLGTLKEEPETASEREQLGERISQLRATKREALEAFRRAERDGDIKAAEEHLHRAVRADSGDEQLHDLLRRLPMRAPRVGARREAGSVILTWDVYDETARHTVYRSTRPITAALDGTVVAADVSGGRCTDRSAPAGEHVHYAVVAARPGGSPSPPGLVDLDILPEPTDVTADASSDAIDITWSVPRACHSVAIEILGTDGRTDRHEAVGTTLHRFTGLETGRSYRITATARYLTVDGPRTSEPVSITATPRGTARPVHDLEVLEDPRSAGDDFLARWTAAPGFAVSLWAFPRGSAPPEGRQVSAAEARSAGGHELHVPVRAVGPDRFEARLSDVAGPALIVPMLEAGPHLLTGRSALSGSATAVRGVRISAFADQLRLTWSWPESSPLVEVEWKHGGSALTRQITPAQYRDEGGVYLADPAQISDITLTTVVRDSGEEIRSRAVDVPYRARGSEALTYRTRITRSLTGKASVRLELTAPSPAPVTCSVGLFLSRSSVLPMEPDAGQLVQRIDADLPGGGTLQQDIELGRPRSPFWVRLFPLDPSAPRLIDPPTHELRG